jgi:hypothetical protein
MFDGMKNKQKQAHSQNSFLAMENSSAVDAPEDAERIASEYRRLSFVFSSAFPSNCLSGKLCACSWTAGLEKYCQKPIQHTPYHKKRQSQYAFQQQTT